MIELQLLGGLDIGGPHLPPSVRARRHPMALMALVAAAAPQAISRDRIMAFLWPESDAERAGNSLRQTVFLLRRNLGDDLFRPDSANGLRLDASKLKVDLWEFREAIVRRAPDEAVALYRGPFLDGFQVPAIPDFSQWVETERERIERLLVGALEALAVQAAGEGRYGAAVMWRRRQAASDRFSSRVALSLLKDLAAAGDRTGALEYAAMYESMVRLHLEVDPDPAVTEFVASIRNAPAAAMRTRAVDLVLAAETTAIAPMAAAVPALAVSEGMTPAARRGRRGFVPLRGWMVAAGVVALLGTVAAGSLLGSRPAALPQTVIVVASGMTTESGRDTATSLISCVGVACPAGPLPQFAFVVPTHPSYTRPATGTSYILPVPDGTTRPSPGYECCTTAVFENRFKLPANAVSGTISIAVLADNQASVTINGVEFGRQIDRFSADNFIEAATFTTVFAPDPSGINRLHVTLWDGGAALGLNYRAFVTYSTGRDATK